MKAINKSNLTENRANIVLIITNIVALIALLFFSTKMIAQEKKTERIVPTNEVQAAFEKEFPKATPIWSKDYGGEDLDQVRYNAKFKTGNSEALAVYDNLGKLKAYEILISKSDIPSNSISYLDKTYKKYSISEASKVKNDLNETSYEVGIIRDGKFYDAVFDHSGNFTKIIEKD